MKPYDVYKRHTLDSMTQKRFKGKIWKNRHHETRNQMRVEMVIRQKIPEEKNCW